MVVSCKQKAVEQDKPLVNNNTENLVKLNQYLIKRDVATIKAYIARHNWKMTETESGLWYEIIEKGNNKQLTNNQLITINYNIELLDGTKCYSSDSLGAKQFTIGKGNIEAGIEEGIRLLHVGGKARFILPPHLAYGISGDGKHIPPRAILVYSVEIANK